MKYSLAGLWQLSPLTDLSIAQNDICFPAALSFALPDSLSEDDIAAQEWHLMHDIEIDDVMLSYAGIDLVLEGIDFYAEVRLNGAAIFDCDGCESVYKKDIRPFLKRGRNRFEIIFLNSEEDWLIETLEMNCPLGFLAGQSVRHYDTRIGIWREPYLLCIRHLRLKYLSVEQIWHQGGGCELLIHIYFDVLAIGLISASIRFDGMTYHIPIDVRSHQASALFQIDAPRYYDPEHPREEDLYSLRVQLDGQIQVCQIGLSEGLSVTHFPL
jgi:hypothetical protein